MDDEQAAWRDLKDSPGWARLLSHAHEEWHGPAFAQLVENLGLGEPSTATIRIGDNDPGVRLSQGDYWVSENGGTLPVWVDRGNDFETDAFTVNYATSGGTATPDADYTSTFGTLAFGAGEQTKSIAIPILNDGLREPEEYFQLTLSQVSGGASLGEPSTATIRIGDTDSGVCWSQSWSAIGEATDGFLATLRRGNDGNLFPLTASYEVVGISATESQDFVAASGTLSWEAGEGDKQVETCRQTFQLCRWHLHQL